MSLFESKISAIEVAAGLADAVLEWCTHEALKEHKEFLEVPDEANNFEKETIYLYLFFVTYTCEIAYSGDDTVCRIILDAFHKRVYASLNNMYLSDFTEFESTLRDRYSAYHDLKHRGSDFLIQQLPYDFVGHLRGRTRESLIARDEFMSGSVLDKWGMTTIKMQIWLGQMFIEMIDQQKAINKKYQIIVE